MKGIYTIEAGTEFPVKVQVFTESGWVHFDSYTTAYRAKTDCARRGIEITRSTKAQVKASAVLRIKRRRGQI